MDNMYVRYAKAINAGERNIDNLKGVMRERVQTELDQLATGKVEETPIASPGHIPNTPDSVQANVPK